MESVRDRLVEAAARLLAEGGPSSLSARKVASRVGASTMVLYTHFGGMPELMRAVVSEGFVRLARFLDAVPVTDDPVADLGLLGAAYRANALANSDLFAAMFSPAGRDERLSGGGLELAAGTFQVMIDAAARAIEAGRFRPADPAVLARQMWSAVHGYVMLELAGHHKGDADAEKILVPLLCTLALGYGDTPEQVERSMATVERSLSLLG